MNQFAGTWRLVRLILRRDRIKLPIWILIIVGMAASMPAALHETYGTPEARESYAAAIGVSVVGRMFGGLLDGTSLGAVLMVESFAFIAVLIAVMNTLLVTRHTRQNEEAGRMELIQSARVGRFSSLVAVLIVALVANLVVAVGIALSLDASGYFPSEGNWLYAAAQGAVGLGFMAIAALTVQLFTNARTTNVALAATLGLAYLLRGFGDGFARTVDGRLEALWPSWLSPLGWGQAVYPYTRQEVWVFGLFGIFAVLCVALAFVVMSRRDVGVGIFSDRPGRPRAGRWLGTVPGLAWRLQRGTLIGWTIVMIIFGAIAGSMTGQLETLVNDNPVLEQYVTAIGGEGKLTDAFYGSMIGLAGLTLVAYVVQSLQRLGSEETAGRLEPTLAGGVNKYGWMASHVVISLLGSAWLLAVMGASTGLTAVLTENEPFRLVGEFTLAALAYLPAVAVCWGIVAFAFSLKPWLAAAIGWSVFGVLMGISQVGALLNLPDWVIDISPFEHVPAAPVETITAAPLVTLSSIGLVLVVVGLLAFRRRSIVTTE